MYYAEKSFSVLNAINDVEICLKNNAVFAALLVALTLPDVCGTVEYPNLGVGQRYKKWYENYIYNIISPPSEEILPFDFTAKFAYALRCALVHQSNTKVAKLNVMIPLDMGKCGMIASAGSHPPVWIEARNICRLICDCVRSYYEKNRDKCDALIYPNVYVYQTSEK